MVAWTTNTPEQCDIYRFKIKFHPGKFFHELISSPITLGTVETGRVQVFIHLHDCLWYFMYTCVDAGVKEGAPKYEMARDIENIPLMVASDHSLSLKIILRLMVSI